MQPKYETSMFGVYNIRAEVRGALLHLLLDDQVHFGKVNKWRCTLKVFFALTKEITCVGSDALAVADLILMEHAITDHTRRRQENK
jgi:hypothetical protein